MTEPISISLQRAVIETGISYSTLYDHARRGVLKTRRNGKKYVVMMADLREYVENLPSGADEDEAS